MKNWKTTLIGLLTAILNAVLPIVNNGQIQPRDIAVSAGIAALGYFSKDFNVTGGDVDQ